MVGKGQYVPNSYRFKPSVLHSPRATLVKTGISSPLYKEIISECPANLRTFQVEESAVPAVILTLLRWVLEMIYVVPLILVSAVRSLHSRSTMEVAGTSETSIKFYRFTRSYNPEGSHLPYLRLTTCVMCQCCQCRCRVNGCAVARSSSNFVEKVR
jgi:hypothetical protein